MVWNIPVVNCGQLWSAVPDVSPQGFSCPSRLLTGGLHEEQKRAPCKHCSSARKTSLCCQHCFHHKTKHSPMPSTLKKIIPAKPRTIRGMILWYFYYWLFVWDQCSVLDGNKTPNCNGELLLFYTREQWHIETLTLMVSLVCRECSVKAFCYVWIDITGIVGPTWIEPGSTQYRDGPDRKTNVSDRQDLISALG